MVQDPLASIPGVIRREVVHPETGEAHEYFLGTLRSDLAKMLTFVPVMENSKKTYLNEITDEGYQRPGSAVRMRLFGDFVRKHPVSVVPPVILSARGGWSFDDATSSLKAFKMAVVIDGQHRMGGYVYLYEDDEIVRQVQFVLLPTLTLGEEKNEFLTINNTQKGVSPSLTEYVEGTEAALIGQELNKRGDSPLIGRVTIASKKPGEHFSLAAVAKNVKRTFGHGAFEDVELDQKVEIVVRYWTIIADAFPEEWRDLGLPPKDQSFKLLETTGLIAWSLAAEDILGPAFNSDTKTMDWERVDASVEKLASTDCVDWRKDGEFQGLTGEVGGARIHKRIQYCLQLDLSEDDSDSASEA